MEIRQSDPRGHKVAILIQEHLREFADVSPPKSNHALGIDTLCGSGVTFWAAWEDQALFGCGALLELHSRHGEIKSMRTVTCHRRNGVASAILKHIIDVARQRSYARLSLETGSMEAFAPAREFYSRAGFVACKPFASYEADPNSVFMTLTL